MLIYSKHTTHTFHPIFWFSCFFLVHTSYTRYPMKWWHLAPRRTSTSSMSGKTPMPHSTHTAESRTPVPHSTHAPDPAVLASASQLGPLLWLISCCHLSATGGNSDFLTGTSETILTTHSFPGRQTPLCHCPWPIQIFNNIISKTCA